MQKNYTALQCLSLILNHLGIKADTAELIKQYGLTDSSVSWDKLARIAKRCKCKTRLVRQNRPSLEDIPVPALIRMQNGSYVILGLHTEETVFISDPQREQPVALPKKEFFAAWTGEVLVFTNSFDWQQFVRKYHLRWFYEIIMHYKRFFAEAAAASFFLQLLGLVMPLGTQVVIDKVIGNEGMSTLTVLGIGMTVLCLFQAAMGALRTYFLTHTTNKLDAILGTRLFRHLISLPLAYYDHRRVGDTMMRVGALNSIREFLTGTSLTALLDLCFSFIFLGFLFYYSVPLTLLVLLVVPLYLVQNIWATPIYKRRLEEVWQAGAANNAFLVEGVTGMQTVKSLALEPQFNHRWQKLMASYVRSAFNQASFGIVISSGSQMIQKVINLLILWGCGRMVMAGEFTLGQMIAFQMIAAQTMGPLCHVLTLWPQVQQTGLSLERIGDILSTSREQVFAAPQENSRLRGEIVLENVSFRYRLDLPLVLENISLSIPAGMKVGIVGRSGSGKSTLTGLIQKLYLPEQGKITIDGIDLKKADCTWLRRNIGAVMQENFLFHGTIRDNIALSRPTASMAEIIRAAELAGAHEFILELPEGYDSEVGERGTTLSGGQRQRIAIARALLADPPIIIFDEATSALDYETERIVMNNINRIAENRTMLIIAHRLSTVEGCDQIIVLDKGKVVQSGTHAELVACEGLYQSLYRQQEVLR